MANSIFDEQDVVNEPILEQSPLSIFDEQDVVEEAQPSPIVQQEQPKVQQQEPDFRSTLVATESGGRVDAASPYSSARGLYQFVDKTGNAIAKKLGIGEWRVMPGDSEEEKQKKAELQTQMFDYWEKNTLEPAAERLSSIPNASKYTHNQLKAMVHFVGEGGARSYLTTGKDPTEKTKGNIPIEKYVGKFKPPVPFGETPAPKAPIPTGKSIFDETDELSVGEQIALGLKRQYAPFSIDSRQEAQQSYSIPAVIANIGASIAQYSALPAIGGAVAGPAGAITGTVGAIGLGLYSAIGEEAVNAKMEGRDFSVKNATVNILTEANPLVLLGKAGKVSKIIGGLSQAGVQAEQARQYGAGEGGMLLGALIGGGAGAMSTGNVRKMMDNMKGADIATAVAVSSPRVKLTKEGAEALFDEVKDNATLRDSVIENMQKISKDHEKAKSLIIPNLKKDMSEFVKDEKLATRLNNEKASFIRWMADLTESEKKLKGKGGLDAVLESVQKQGLDVNSLFDTWREAQVIKKQLMKQVRARTTNLLGEPVEAISGKGIFGKLNDPSNIAQDTDKINGVTKMQESLYNIDSGINRMEVDNAQFILRLDKLKKEASKQGLDAKKLSSILKTVDEKRRTLLKISPEARAAQLDALIPTQYKDIINKFKAFTDDLHTYQVDAGLLNKGQYIEYYMPHITVSSDDAISRLKREIVRLKQFAADNEGLGIAKALQDDSFKNLRRLMHQTKASITDEASLDRFAKQITQPRVYKKLADRIEAASSFKREYRINPLILEDDPFRAYAALVNNVTRTKHLSKPLTQMKAEVEILRSVNMNKTADYWDKYIGQMYGKKSLFKQSVDEGITKYKVWVKNNADELRRELNFKEKAMLYAPDMLSWMMGNAYPNLLGFSNIYAPIRNLTQPHVMTAREFLKLANKNAKVFAKNGDSVYVHGLTSKAQGKMLMESMAHSPFKSINRWTEILRKEGRMPGDFLGVGNQVAEQSLRNVPGIGKAVEKLESLNKLGMWLYQSSDVANRWATREMSIEIVKDAFAGKKRSLDMIGNLPGSYGAKIRNAIKNGDVKTAEDSVIDYMLGKTQYHYGKHAMSEFGREYGQLVSMFTKWPSSVFGEIASDVKQRHYRDILMKYFTPIIALFGANEASKMIMGEDNPTRKALLGKSMIDISPLWSASGIISVPPVIDSAQKAVSLGKKALSGDAGPEEILKDIRKITGKYIPIVGAIETYQRRYGE